MESQSPKPMRVLIVEDDRASRVTLRKILKSIGSLEVVEAADGQEAWELLQGSALPGLCFVDINMPRMSGLQLLQRVRGDPRLAGLKVCFCSAIRDRRVIIQAAAFQPDYYILKPYSREVILARVQSARAQEEPVHSVEAAEEVCERLGIDLPTYLSLHEDFRDKLRELTTRVPTLLTRLDIPEAIIALDGVRATACTLGAGRAISLIEHLTRLIKSSSSVLGDGTVTKDEIAANLPKWLARSTDQLFQITQEIRHEADTLAQLAEQAAKVQDSLKPRAQAPAPPERPTLG
jgi:two-component system, chemotaxis family, chemotaxis protein CheY